MLIVELLIQQGIDSDWHIFVFKGGRINSRDVWIYNSQLNIWIRVASLNKGRWRHKMAVLLGKVREVYLSSFSGGNTCFLHCFLTCRLAIISYFLLDNLKKTYSYKRIF